VVDIYREGRGEALGWYTSFSQAGRLSGRMIGGYFLVWFGFRETFGACAVIGLVLLLLFPLLILPRDHPSRPSARHHSRSELMSGLREICSDPRVLMGSGMEAVLMTASGALMAFLPLYGIDAGLHPGQIGLLFGGMGIASIVAKPIMGRISDRTDRRRLIIAGELICASAVAALPWNEGFAGLLFLSLLFGFGEAVIGSSTSAWVADLCKEKSLGSAMGVFGTIMDTGHVGGPILTGVLIGLAGYAGAFAGIGLILVIMTLLFARMTRAIEVER